MVKYKIHNGTSYQEGTPDSVISAIESAFKNRIRIKIYFGDHKTGKCWDCENDTIGYVGRSTGINKVPLLVHNSRSIGGIAIQTDAILKIRESKGNRVLYQHPKFTPSKIEIKESAEHGYTHSVYINDELYSNHKSIISAKTLTNKLN